MKRLDRVLLFFALSSSILIIGCGHTNKLANYNVRSQPFEILSEATTAGAASSSVASGTGNSLGDILAGINSSTLSEETAAKLRRAANADALAAQISKGFENALVSYLAVAPTKGYNPSATYRAETVLQNYSLSSDSTGTSAHISAISRIIQRSSGALVWQYSSSKDIALSTTSSSRTDGRAMLSAVNAASLASMSESEIADIFHNAARQIGSDIGETLREDVAELAKH